MSFKHDSAFQTPEKVCELMADTLPGRCAVLETTPGDGNLVKALIKAGHVVHTPKGDFWEMQHKTKYDYVVMNPPFTPSVEGFRYLQHCLTLADNVIALLPWMVIINSMRRLDIIREYGLVSVTNLPRKTFPGSRVQCCLLEMKRGYNEETIFKTFNW